MKASAEESISFFHPQLKKPGVPLSQDLQCAPDTRQQLDKPSTLIYMLPISLHNYVTLSWWLVDEGRRWRSTRPFGGVTEWEYEIGDPPSTQETAMTGTAGVLRPSHLNVSGRRVPCEYICRSCVSQNILSAGRVYTAWRLPIRERVARVFSMFWRHFRYSGHMFFASDSTAAVAPLLLYISARE